MYIRQAPKVCRFDFPGRGVVPRKATDLCVCVCVCVCVSSINTSSGEDFLKKGMYMHTNTRLQEMVVLFHILYSLNRKSSESSVFWTKWCMSLFCQIWTVACIYSRVLSTCIGLSDYSPRSNGRTQKPCVLVCGRASMCMSLGAW